MLTVSTDLTLFHLFNYTTKAPCGSRKMFQNTNWSLNSFWLNIDIKYNNPMFKLNIDIKLNDNYH